MLKQAQRTANRRALGLDVERWQRSLAQRPRHHGNAFHRPAQRNPLPSRQRAKRRLQQPNLGRFVNFIDPCFPGEGQNPVGHRLRFRIGIAIDHRAASQIALAQRHRINTVSDMHAAFCVLTHSATLECARSFRNGTIVVSNSTESRTLAPLSADELLTGYVPNFKYMNHQPRTI